MLCSCAVGVVHLPYHHPEQIFLVNKKHRSSYFNNQNLFLTAYLQHFNYTLIYKTKKNLITFSSQREGGGAILLIFLVICVGNTPIPFIF